VFFEDIAAWGWSSAPPGRLLHHTDLPRLPEPMPRALPPEADAALMAAVRHRGKRRVELPEQVQISLGELAGRARRPRQGRAARVRCGRRAGGVRYAARGGRHRPRGTEGSTQPRPERLPPLEATILDRARRTQGGGGAQRVRSVSGEEFTLPTWVAFAGDDLLAEMATERMLAGLSSRRYEVGLEPVGAVEGSGTSKSTVSRRFVERTRTVLGELMARDLSELGLCALFGDGIELAGHTVVVAVGVDHDGRKHVLGLKEGSTENATACGGLLADLTERGLDVSSGILLVLDGGKGWRKAVRDAFGDLALVQRCRLHKERNVIGYLPDHLHAEVRRRLRKAWGRTDPDQALRELQAIATWLEGRGHPSAAGSLREGMEETLTIVRLGVPPKLSVSLFLHEHRGVGDLGRPRVMGNVKRWRPRSKTRMIERWCAAGLLVAERQFRRVKGHREIPFLVAALKAHVEKVSEARARVA